MLRFFFIRGKANYNGMSRNASTFLKIGDVKVPVRESTNQELVPAGFADTNVPQSIVQTIKWMLKKDALDQDIFLVGVPGFLRSQIVLQFLELCNREFEYLPISRDTTEADIKQRREIAAGSVLYSDLCAVRAALNGRVLVIDGVEKAERNVLPILNNLLENREMQLDDGRFLMSAARFDRLLERYSLEQLRKWKLERVSPNFRVIALGLPVPPFHGHTLDPPLRSRFQSRSVTPLPYDILTRLARAAAPKVDAERVDRLLAVSYALLSQNEKIGWVFDDAAEGSSTDRSKRPKIGRTPERDLARLPLLPIDNLLIALRVWNNNPTMSDRRVFELCCPVTAATGIDNYEALIREFFHRFGIGYNDVDSGKEPVDSADIVDAAVGDQRLADVRLSTSGTVFQVSRGSSTQNAASGDSPFVSTGGLENALAEMLVTHSQADFCLLGGRGTGKTALVEEFARRLNYGVSTMVLYQDINSRELVQRRRILPNGDTVWEDSQLIAAAKRGDLCVLDGVERLHWSTLELLAPLIHHRFLQLPDGSRLVGAAQFALLKQRTGLDDAQLAERGVHPIADTFRIVAVGDSENEKWLNDQVLSLFLFHKLRPLSVAEEWAIIRSLVPDVCETTACKLLTLSHSLRASKDASVRGLSVSLSLRRLIFLLRRHARDPTEDVHAAVSRAVLSRFLPAVVREVFEAKVREYGILPLDERLRGGPPVHGWLDQLVAGRPQANGVERSPYEEAMVPDVLFYDNKQHLQVMELMSKDFELGSHLLLIGNQGVGKNKVVDRFLNLINRPRQYMQLHRDTTVQSLTVQTTVADGVLRYEDSALVKAVREGFALVVDEADKAPLHVVAVLKSLLDSGVLHLADGRVIRPAHQCAVENGDESVIPMHKDFRIIMLANRPGFPFLGNDLFAMLGDLFSVHVVENPLPPSEIVMLKKYGPGRDVTDVPEATLTLLVSAFGDLREMADQSLLTYPYSTRELVNIVKHLQRFPDEPIGNVIRNVFDFDAYSSDVIDIVRRVFEQRGLSLQVGSSDGTVNWWSRVFNTSGLESIAPDRIEFERDVSEFDVSKLDTPKFGKVDPDNTPHVGGNTWAGGTGGYNTAGLGGVGGPFRLDAGHNVHQIPDEAKKQVPDHILKKAREIAKQEYAKKLKEIEMSPYDAEAYGDLYEKVVKQAKVLRTIVDSLVAREHERQWAKHQTSGDLDDGKLIDGMTGEKNIYRRRVELAPEDGSQLTKPKRIRLCFDVSGSMYRFNGVDQRLQRSIEAALLVMEAFEGKQDKIKYDIYGHSGESPSVPFVKTDALPANEKQKIDILKRMLAHTQYCWSGDHTLQAIYESVKELKKETNVDERIAIILSDANLERYGITPDDLTRALTSDENVNTFLILIGSLGSQALRIQSALPRGKAFVANNAAEIPQIMQKIFSSTIGK